MANTLVVDDTASAGLDYFKSSFSVPLYDSRLSDTYYKSFFPVSGVKSVDSIRFSIPAKKGNKLLNIDLLLVSIFDAPTKTSPGCLPWIAVINE